VQQAIRFSEHYGRYHLSCAYFFLLYLLSSHVFFQKQFSLTNIFTCSDTEGRDIEHDFEEVFRHI